MRPPSPIPFLSLLLALCLHEAAVSPALAAGPVDSGDEALPASDGAGGAPGPAGRRAEDVFGAQTSGYSYAPSLQEKLRDARTVINRFQTTLKQTELQLQTLHNLDEISDVLHRNPDVRVRVTRTDQRPGAQLSPGEQDSQSRDVYRALRERGVPPSRME